MSAIEMLLALPVLLLAGLGALQLALLYRAQHVLNHAVFEAARAGSLAHASPEAVRDGLARGLAPWLHGAATLEEHAMAIVRARAHVGEGEAAGWILVEQQSPTAASFADWAEPALDDGGLPMPDVREIPNDGLVHRARRARPAGGVAGMRGDEAIGAASGQTLADANLLRLRLRYGVPMVVPLAGRVIARTLRAWNGCGPPRTTRAGALVLAPEPPTASADPAACAFYGADDAGRPRAPVSASATVRMQSPARMTEATPADTPSHGSRTDPGPGTAPGREPAPRSGDARRAGEGGASRPPAPAAPSTRPPTSSSPSWSPSAAILAGARPDPAVCDAAVR